MSIFICIADIYYYSTNNIKRLLCLKVKAIGGILCFKDFWKLGGNDEECESSPTKSQENDDITPLPIRLKEMGLLSLSSNICIKYYDSRFINESNY